MEWQNGEYVLTDDRDRVDLDVVCAMLRETYWASSRSRELISLSVRNSVCFSLFHRDRQIGLARVLSDYGASSYLCDVVIDAAHRSRGIGTWMLERILDHPSVRQTRALLITRDAQPFYRKLGFVKHPYECMLRPDEPAAIP